MNVLYISRLFSPHVGGVESHLQKVIQKIKVNTITIITEKYDDDLKDLDYYHGASVFRIRYKHIKIIGLLNIWNEIYKLRKLIQGADVVHMHDVHIWYFPFIFLYPNKKRVITIHGLEWNNPQNIFSLLQKYIALKNTRASVGVGKFLEKYIKIRFSKIIYGAADIHNYKTPKDKNTIIFVGRLEENTGLLQFLKWLDKNPGYKVDFCGDGDQRKYCEKYGKVHGFCDPNPFYKKAKLVVPGGYLAALEALNSGCDIKLFWNNKVKEDYWKMSPFYKLKGEKLRTWARKQTWEKLANEYMELYSQVLNEKH